MYKFVSGAKSVKQYRGDENLPEAKNGMKKGCGCKHSKSKYKYQAGGKSIAVDDLELPEGDVPISYNSPVQKVNKTKSSTKKTIDRTPTVPKKSVIPVNQYSDFDENKITKDRFNYLKGLEEKSRKQDSTYYANNIGRQIEQAAGNNTRVYVTENREGKPLKGKKSGDNTCITGVCNVAKKAGAKIPFNSAIAEDRNSPFDNPIQTRYNPAFRDNAESMGFKLLPQTGKMQRGDIVQLNEKGNPHHAMLYYGDDYKGSIFGNDVGNEDDGRSFFGLGPKKDLGFEKRWMGPFSNRSTSSINPIAKNALAYRYMGVPSKKASMQEAVAYTKAEKAKYLKNQELLAKRNIKKEIPKTNSQQIAFNTGPLSEELTFQKNGNKSIMSNRLNKYKYGTGAITIPEGSAIVTANGGKNKQALMAYKKGNYKLLNNIIDDMPEDNVDKAKKGIKNTYRKYKFQEGVNSVNADEDDTWIRKILNFESTKGSSEGKGLSNFGYNDWKKLGHSRPPESIDEAVEYYKKDYLPKVKNYPVEVRKRIGDYIFNTGRSPEDLLLHASGKLSLKELNSTGTSKDKWETNKGEIEKMFSDPNFISKLDKSRDDVYKTTKTTNGQPNSAYNNSWKDRVNLFNDNASSSTNNAPVSQNTQTQQTQGPVNSASSQTPVPSTQNTPQGNSKVTEIKGNLSTDPITKETYQENFVLGGPKKYGKEMSLDKAKNLYGLTDEQFETAYGKNKKSDTYRIEKGRRQAIKDKNVYYNVAGKVDKNGELLKYSSGYKTQPNEGEKPKETPVKLPPPPEEIPPPTTKTPPDDTGKRKEYVTMPSMAEIAARSSILGQGIEGIPENYLKLGRYNYASQLDRTLRENAIAANTAKENIRDVSGGSAGSYLSNVANITGKRFDANAGAVTQDTLARQDILNKNVDLGNTEAQVNTGLKNQYAELRGKARSNYNDQLVALGQRIDSATETAQEMSNQRGADDQRMQVLKDLGLNYEYQNVNGLKKLVPKVPVNTPPTTTGTPDAVSKKGLKKVKTYKRR